MYVLEWKEEQGEFTKGTIAQLESGNDCKAFEWTVAEFKSPGASNLRWTSPEFSTGQVKWTLGLHYVSEEVAE
jgi:hypothetical protein